VKPATIIGELAVRQRRLLNERHVLGLLRVASSGALCTDIDFSVKVLLVLSVEVHDGGEEEHDDGQVDAQFHHLALEEEVQVAICATVEHPILHLQLVNDRQKHPLKDGEGLRLGVQASLIHLLNVDVLINW